MLMAPAIPTATKGRISLAPRPSSSIPIEWCVINISGKIPTIARRITRSYLRSNRSKNRMATNLLELCGGWVVSMKIGFESKKGSTGLLLLHGLSGTPSEVQPLGDYLSDKGISVLGPWLKGHDTNPKDLAKTRWQDWAGSVHEAYDHLKKNCSKIFVGGLSMVADQALHLAANIPVAGVISMAAPVKIFDFRFNGIAFFRFLQWRTSNLTGG